MITERRDTTILDMGNNRVVSSPEAHTPEAKATLLNSEAMQPMGKVPRCIDDRQLLKGLDNSPNIVNEADFNGPQWLGGSIAPLALVVETAPPNTNINLETALAITSTAHKTLGLKIGVHMDDDHGHASPKEIVGQIKGNGDLAGCGFAGLLMSDDNPLNLSDRTRKLLTSHNLVRTLVNNGAQISILTGNHTPTPDVLAIENHDPTTTLDQAIANNLGTPSYDHDTGRFVDMIEALTKETDKISPEWANNIRSNAASINNRWLNTTTQILAGMNPIPINFPNGLDHH